MTVPLVAPASALITPSSWVYYAQRAISGAWIDRAGLPLENVALTWDLATDQFTAEISPAIAMAPAADGRPVIDEWSTLVYAVADGVIRWGGIVNHSELSGPSWSISGIGMRGYPSGVPYLGTPYKTWTVDPLDVVRMLWAHVQSYPAGNLHLAVDAATHSQVTIGTAAQPYELDSWNMTDCGQEITTLLGTVPAEQSETHAWTAGGEGVSHAVTFGVPRVGRRRDDLRFVEDENLHEVVPLSRDGTTYANMVAGTGAGTGSTTVSAQAAVDDGRLRRVATWTDQTITTSSVLKPLVQRILTARQVMGGAASAVLSNHPNAPLGSVGVGDDILLQFVSGWAGGQAIWHRVTSITLEPATGDTTLALARSDSFAYVPSA